MYEINYDNDDEDDDDNEDYDVFSSSQKISNTISTIFNLYIRSIWSPKKIILNLGIIHQIGSHIPRNVSQKKFHFNINQNKLFRKKKEKNRWEKNFGWQGSYSVNIFLFLVIGSAGGWTLIQKKVLFCSPLQTFKELWNFFNNNNLYYYIYFNFYSNGTYRGDGILSINKL